MKSHLCSGLSENGKDVLVCPRLMNTLVMVSSSHFQGVVFSLSHLRTLHHLYSVHTDYPVAREVNSKPFRFFQLPQKQPLLPENFGHMEKKKSAFSGCLKHWLARHPGICRRWLLCICTLK